MEQMVIDLTTAEILPKGYVPCSNPQLVEGYVSIADIFEGHSVDFYWCHSCDERWCDCNMDEKRADPSYWPLLEHFRSGGAMNQPVNWVPYEGRQYNGHHRIVAAHDAGFTHVPYNSRKWGDDFDWSDTPSAEGLDPSDLLH